MITQLRQAQAQSPIQVPLLLMTDQEGGLVRRLPGAPTGTTGQKAVTAAGAGMDVILCSARDVTQAEAATSALATALGNGQLDPNAFNAAVNRVTNLRAGLF